MSQPKRKIEPIQIVLCDDVREELNGKFSLVGVYPDGITVPSVPARIIFSLWITIKVSTEGEFPIHIKIKGPKDDDHIGIKGMLKVEKFTNDNQIIPVYFKQLPFTPTRPGSVEILFSSDDKIWKTLRTFNLQAASIEPKQKTDKP